MDRQRGKKNIGAAGRPAECCTQRMLTGVQVDCCTQEHTQVLTVIYSIFYYLQGSLIFFLICVEMDVRMPKWNFVCL